MCLQARQPYPRILSLKIKWFQLSPSPVSIHVDDHSANEMENILLIQIDFILKP